ncbi:hypothetical protein CGRA01v4_03887 [Colletotrichum graminicola]|uniref:Tat pathway signal sequence n=1 Tax=Colletotrichum graminicola (strain M1.001 / M2 / FGSC 10212) TaxID=645133 RepID=E3QTL5_COLGM|nr:uncharacterized protein GLRG_09434 [Colletotrichum graminicola M1.001]EFQ34290.1 hypothetical protein GLRG_09434 [Colletotrichum graminicola M1.001]WDK12607.1 hypothetical protein CGRA01v4_03887 [Colletotrichum graminicola]
MWFSKSPYTGLKSSDSEDELGVPEKQAHRCLPLSLARVPLLLTIAASGWFLSGILFVILIFQNGDVGKHDCFVETSVYSPLVEYVPHRLVKARTNGTLDYPSKFRGRPSQELDDNWDSVSIFRPLDIPISDEQYSKFGASIETAVRSQTNPDTSFFVQPEFSHQLHCVNLLRKTTYFNFDYYRDTGFDFRGRDEQMIQTHVDHCIEIIRQFVMCHADVGLVASHWIAEANHPWPDFNTNKVCRDFEGILDWTLRHQAPLGTEMIPKKPHGAKALATPP